MKVRYRNKKKFELKKEKKEIVKAHLEPIKPKFKVQGFLLHDKRKA